MRRKNTKPVDKERLIKAIERKGIDIYEAGELCNKSRRYVRNFADRKRIGDDNIRDIEENLGIAYSEYCPVNEEEENKRIELKKLIQIAKTENIEIEIVVLDYGKMVRIKPLG